MQNQHRRPWTVSIAALLGALCLALAASSCTASGGGSPIIASVDVRSDVADPSSVVAFARSNVTDVAVVGGKVGVLAGLYLTGGIPVVVPYTVAANRIVAINRRTGEKAEVAWGDPLPAWALQAFPGGLLEAEALGLSFLPEPE